MADAELADDLLTLHEAANRLKVHYMTAYRWVRRGDLPAFKAGGRLRIRHDDLARFMTDRRIDVALGDGTEGRTDWDRHIPRLLDLLLNGDAPGASALVRRVIADGAPAGDVYRHLLTPVLHTIGEDWAAGRITVAEEHRASEIASALMARLGELFHKHGPKRGSAVTLTPPGDLHGIGSQMVADFLRAAGYDVHHLGANVPLDDLRLFLQVVPADVVAVSVTIPTLDARTYGALVEAARADDGDRQVVFGGQGADPDAVEAAAAVYAGDLDGLLTALDLEPVDGG